MPCRPLRIRPFGDLGPASNHAICQARVQAAANCPRTIVKQQPTVATLENIPQSERNLLLSQQLAKLQGIGAGVLLGMENFVRS